MSKTKKSKNKKQKLATANVKKEAPRQSRRREQTLRWDKLDNTAHLFPVIAGESMTNTYRIAAELNEEVDGEKLQRSEERRVGKECL